MFVCNYVYFAAKVVIVGFLSSSDLWVSNVTCCSINFEIAEYVFDINFWIQFTIIRNHFFASTVSLAGNIHMDLLKKYYIFSILKNLGWNGWLLGQKFQLSPSESLSS